MSAHSAPTLRVDHGWVKEGVSVSPMLQVTPRRRRQRSLWQSILGAREEEPEPVVSEPILRRLGDDEIALVEAAELFNATQFRRTIAGVAKALGEPQASITPLSGVNARDGADVRLGHLVVPVPRLAGVVAAGPRRRARPGHRRSRPELPALERDGDRRRPADPEHRPHLSSDVDHRCHNLRTDAARPARRRPRAASTAATSSSRTPITGEELARVTRTDEAATDAAIARAAEAFVAWRDLPGPHRGELVRLLGEELRREKESLGALVTLEVGKIAQEGLGEVQEMIDICDFAVGLSRQLYGRSIASERPGHRLTETWHPLGPVAVISAFNFPVAVWSWNAALAFVCGDPVIWKPSERTPLTALACMSLFERAAERFGGVPDGLAELVIGGADRAVQLADDPRIPLVSATGSTQMGKELAPRIAARLGRSLLELGGNNAADRGAERRPRPGRARRALLRRRHRRPALHEPPAPDRARVDRRRRRRPARRRPTAASRSATRASRARSSARSSAPTRSRGSRRHSTMRGRTGERSLPAASGLLPTNGPTPGTRARRSCGCRRRARSSSAETFAPLLYVLTYAEPEEAIAIQNGVPQGLASSIFTTDLREAERFLASSGSDCGIANVNIGPSGAEIGGAFGGEKETGGGRESGSDAWKAYMRRQTATVNFTSELPLAQGIVFDVP